LNAKYTFRNSVVSKRSGAKLLNFIEMGLKFQHQCPTHYYPMGNGDVLHRVVHKEVQLPQVIFCDILDYDHLPIVFHLLDLIKTRNTSVPIDKFRDW
jgi:hypothetical protein